MVPLQEMIVADVKSPLLVLLGAVGLVLLIACANIANLLLTRATSRAREITVRTTLGAGRARIVRQLLSETALLGLLGGATGIALAYWGVHILSSLPPGLPRVNAIRVDHLVLGFALLLSLLASCAFGLAPALLSTNANLQASLREGGGRSGEGRNRRRVRSLLAAGEVALATPRAAGQCPFSYTEGAYHSTTLPLLKVRVRLSPRLILSLLPLNIVLPPPRTIAFTTT
jgi:putative ABC transport system permease protein